MEDEVEFGLGSIFGDDGFLSVAEDFGAEFNSAGFVVPVNVTEGSGEHEASESIEGFVDGDHVFGGGVEFFVGDAGVIDAVFFTADDTSFDFEDDFLFVADGEEFAAEGHVFVEREFGAIEHVRIEEVSEAGFASGSGSGDEWAEVGVDFFGLAVVGVEGDEDVVFFGEAVSSFGEDDGAEDCVFDIETGGKFAGACGELDDAVGFGIREGFEGGVDGDERADVDGRVCVVALLSGIEHLGVLFGSGDRHCLETFGGVCWRKRDGRGIMLAYRGCCKQGEVGVASSVA